MNSSGCIVWGKKSGGKTVVRHAFSAFEEASFTTGKCSSVFCLFCNKNKEKPCKIKCFYRVLVRVGRLELPASCSQMCVGTFSRHSTALFGAFRCFGNSSLELFGPACFKKPFRLLGFVWDWILCIKRCSARFEGQWQGKLPQRSGAGIAPHKQRIKPFPPVA